jgi:hypothetical protein
MTTAEIRKYRGYDILPHRQWSQWCVSVYPTRADLPLLSSSTLRLWHHERKKQWPRRSKESTAS